MKGSVSESFRYVNKKNRLTKNNFSDITFVRGAIRLVKHRGVVIDGGVLE